MLRSGQNQRARRHCDNGFVDADSRTRFCKTSLTAISYAIASGIVALLLAYWPASAGNILAQLRISQADQISTSQILDRTHKASRLYVMPFEQRWSAVPAQANPIRGDSGQRTQPQAERRIEKIPFSCELAFSRLVMKGNFSTRCMARAREFGTVALG
jgi:hypothetical protein